MKVLIVSGTDTTSAWMRSSLDPSWVIREADDGNEAIRMVRAAAVAAQKAVRRGSRRGRAATTPFDLVIADDSTEPFGAFGLAREIKEVEGAPRIIVLLQRAQDSWLAKWSGADRWVLKPVDPFELRAVADTLLAEEPEHDVDLVLGDPDDGVTESDVEREAVELSGDAG